MCLPVRVSAPRSAQHQDHRLSLLSREKDSGRRSAFAVFAAVSDVLGEVVVCNTYGKVDTSVIAVIQFRVSFLAHTPLPGIRCAAFLYRRRSFVVKASSDYSLAI